MYPSPKAQSICLFPETDSPSQDRHKPADSAELIYARFCPAPPPGRERQDGAIRNGAETEKAMRLSSVFRIKSAIAQEEKARDTCPDPGSGQERNSSTQSANARGTKYVPSRQACCGILLLATQIPLSPTFSHFFPQSSHRLFHIAARCLLALKHI